MLTLEQLLQQDRRARTDAQLTPEQYRMVLEGAVPILREGTKRGAFPTTIINRPGVLKSRHLKVVDLSAAEHGMTGTGGQFDNVNQSTVDEFAYAIWKNIEIPWREQETSADTGFDLLRESGQAAGEKVVEQENTMIVKELGPVKGLTKKSGIQTFASGAAWTTAGQAYKEIVKAVIDKFGTKKVPRGNAALLVNPQEEANLFATFSNTDAAQLEKLQRFLPGGIYSSLDVPTGEAYVYAKTPTCVEYRVYQNWTVVPLPKIDENHRMRVRVIGAFHLKQADSVVKITGCA